MIFYYITCIPYDAKGSRTYIIFKRVQNPFSRWCLSFFYATGLMVAGLATIWLAVLYHFTFIFLYEDSCMDSLSQTQCQQVQYIEINVEFAIFRYNLQN